MSPKNGSTTSKVAKNTTLAEASKNISTGPLHARTPNETIKTDVPEYGDVMSRKEVRRLKKDDPAAYNEMMDKKHKEKEAQGKDSAQEKKTGDTASTTSPSDNDSSHDTVDSPSETSVEAASNKPTASLTNSEKLEEISKDTDNSANKSTVDTCSLKDLSAPDKVKFAKTPTAPFKAQLSKTLSNESPVGLDCCPLTGGNTASKGKKAKKPKRKTQPATVPVEAAGYTPLNSSAPTADNNQPTDSDPQAVSDSESTKSSNGEPVEIPVEVLKQLAALRKSENDYSSPAAPGSEVSESESEAGPDSGPKLKLAYSKPSIRQILTSAKSLSLVTSTDRFRHKRQQRQIETSPKAGTKSKYHKEDHSGHERFTRLKNRAEAKKSTTEQAATLNEDKQEGVYTKALTGPQAAYKQGFHIEGTDGDSTNELAGDDDDAVQTEDISQSHSNIMYDNDIDMPDVENEIDSYEPAGDESIYPPSGDFTFAKDQPSRSESTPEVDPAHAFVLTDRKEKVSTSPVSSQADNPDSPPKIATVLDAILSPCPDSPSDSRKLETPHATSEVNVADKLSDSAETERQSLPPPDATPSQAQAELDESDIILLTPESSIDLENKGTLFSGQAPVPETPVDESIHNAEVQEVTVESSTITDDVNDQVTGKAEGLVTDNEPQHVDESQQSTGPHLQSEPILAEEHLQEPEAQQAQSHPSDTHEHLETHPDAIFRIDALGDAHNYLETDDGLSRGASADFFQDLVHLGDIEASTAFSADTGAVFDTPATPLGLLGLPNSQQFVSPLSAGSVNLLVALHVQPPTLPLTIKEYKKSLRTRQLQKTAVQMSVKMQKEDSIAVEKREQRDGPEQVHEDVPNVDKTETTTKDMGALIQVDNGAEDADTTGPAVVDPAVSYEPKVIGDDVPKATTTKFPMISQQESPKLGALEQTSKLEHHTSQLTQQPDKSNYVSGDTHDTDIMEGLPLNQPDTLPLDGSEQHGGHSKDADINEPPVIEKKPDVAPEEQHPPSTALDENLKVKITEPDNIPSTEHKPETAEQVSVGTPATARTEQLSHTSEHTCVKLPSFLQAMEAFNASAQNWHDAQKASFDESMLALTSMATAASSSTSLEHAAHVNRNTFLGPTSLETS